MSINDIIGKDKTCGRNRMIRLFLVRHGETFWNKEEEHKELKI